jgi:antitoxin ParD1/3/4
MTLTLPPDLERFVQDQIAHGQYSSADGVVEAALRLLRSRHAELRDLVRVGIDQADRGEVAPFDPAATLARVRADTTGARS